MWGLVAVLGLALAAAGFGWYQGEIAKRARFQAEKVQAVLRQQEKDFAKMTEARARQSEAVAEEQATQAKQYAAQANWRVEKADKQALEARRDADRQRKLANQQSRRAELCERGQDHDPGGRGEPQTPR